MFKVVKLIFDLRLLLWFLLSETWTWPEGSYERGSLPPSVHNLPIVCPSSRLPVLKFSQNWIICFSETWYGVRSPYLFICDRGGIFFKKIDVKNGQKRPKIKSLVLSGIGIKRKFLWSFNILWKLHTWEKSGSQVMTKNGSRPIRFQYSLIVNVSLLDWYLTLIFGM